MKTRQLIVAVVLIAIAAVEYAVIAQVDVRRVLAVMTTLLAVGTAGFMLIEGWSLLDSFYMSVITVSTIGWLFKYCRIRVT